jgi:peptidoglycan/xylan/chitin deacetylase (PgdA/CDA1 family)
MKAPLALLYHAIGRVGAAGDLLHRALFVEPAGFARQMEQLADGGYRSTSLDEYAASLEGRISPVKRFLLTFDDGYAHVDELVRPVLERHGFSAVMFVPWAHVGGRNDWDRHPALSGLRIMTPEEIRTLDSSGSWEVASHGGRHVDLRAEEAGVRRRELREARENLSALLGRAVDVLAYPYGYQDAHVREDVRAAGFRLAFTAMGHGPVERYRIPRRPITSWDRGPLFSLRTAPPSAWLYWAEDVARAPLSLRHRLRQRSPT